jgi:signal transduction histidine kinase
MRYRVLIVGLASAVTLGLWFVSAGADRPEVLGQSTVQVTVGTDVCLNIAGFQSSVPSGMQVDGSGNCYTPTPPPPDQCNNISGTQETIPSGYYRDTNGNCFVQPPPPIPPVDVCPNLSGVQEAVPEGYVNDIDGNCIVPPVDVCVNIPGLQTSVPEGLRYNAEDGTCSSPPSAPPTSEPDPDPFVPPAEPRAPAPPATPDAPPSPGISNVPEFLVAYVEPLVEAVPEPIKEAVRSLPPVVAQTFPYYVFASLAVVAGILWIQAIQEIATGAYFIKLLKRQRSIAEQKDNFVALASHYLRTPQTVMANGLDTIESLKEATPENVAAVRAPIEVLGANISGILAEVQNNTALKSIANPQLDSAQKNFLRSGYFWAPVIGSVVIVLAANFLLGVVGEVAIGTLNQIVQIIVFGAVLLLFYSALRNHHTHKRNRAQQQILVDHEQAVDEARNEFLRKTTATLQQGLSDIYNQRPNIASAEHIHFFDDGYTRFLAILTKFNLLAQIRAGAPVHHEPFDLHSSIDATLAKYRPSASEKNIAITNGAATTTVTQNRELFEFVMDSLIDNAVKFTPQGGAITIGAKPGEKTLSVTVSDSGMGIDKEKQSQLFQPFSRTESAVEFNYEGLGFSLFLDKIILEYIGGDIAVNSDGTHGSTFMINATTEEEAIATPSPKAAFARAT